MQVALICPPALLKKYGGRTKYHLVLPHLSQEKRYRDFYRKRSKTDYIILDNGAAEGLKFGTRHLYSVAESLGVHEIVVPDILGDKAKTLELAHIFTRHTRPEYKYMAVAQGRTIQEIMQSIDAYCSDKKYNYISTIGIPRLINIGDVDARRKISEMVHRDIRYHGLDYHYLGSANPFHEVMHLADVGIGRGIDTSAPIYISQLGLRIGNKDAYKARPDDYFSSARIDKQVAEENIDIYLRWAKYVA
jgi:hypothetical protein